MAKKYLCMNPMEIKSTCECGYSQPIKSEKDLNNRNKICPVCKKKTRLKME